MRSMVAGLPGVKLVYKIDARGAGKGMLGDCHWKRNSSSAPSAPGSELEYAW
jgi:hypothetical protein